MIESTTDRFGSRLPDWALANPFQVIQHVVEHPVALGAQRLPVLGIKRLRTVRIRRRLRARQNWVVHSARFLAYAAFASGPRACRLQVAQYIPGLTGVQGRTAPSNTPWLAISVPGMAIEGGCGRPDTARTAWTRYLIRVRLHQTDPALLGWQRLPHRRRCWPGQSAGGYRRKRILKPPTM